MGKLPNLEAFTSLNGPAFYRLPPNDARITLVKHELAQTFPEKILTEAGPVTVFNPGFPVFWNVNPG